jgi:CreA protein
MTRFRATWMLLLLAALAAPVVAEEIGEVSTVFKFLAPDHKIVVEAFDDPKIGGVTCYLSRADAGGFKSLVGLDEDPSDAAITCRQVGPIKVLEALEEGEEVFKQRTSLIFKSMQVVRFYDEARKVFVYQVYSDRLIEGSPKNTVSAVPAMPWLDQPPDLAAIQGCARSGRRAGAVQCPARTSSCTKRSLSSAGGASRKGYRGGWPMLWFRLFTA